MPKILIIEACEYCPHCYLNFGIKDSFWECLKNSKRINPKEIPEWCALPDAEEKHKEASNILTQPSGCFNCGKLHLNGETCEKD